MLQRTFIYRLALAMGLATALVTTSEAAPERVPAFADYAVKEVYRGPAARAVIDTADKRLFRTRLRDAAAEPPNFAGRYVLTTWGCGAGCSMGGVVDLKTGVTAVIPFSICCDRGEVEERIAFRLDSRLVVFTGLRNERGPYGQHSYVFDGRTFRHLKTVETKEEED